MTGIIVHRADARGFKNLGERPFEHLAIFQHVRHAGRAAQIIFQDVNLSVAVTHQISARNMAPDAAWRPQAHTGLEKTFGRLDEKGGDNAVVDDVLGLVDIINEEIEGLNALLQPTLNERPIARFHNARDDIEREDALRPSRITVDVERDPHLQKGMLSSPLAPQEFTCRQSLNPLYQQG